MRAILRPIHWFRSLLWQRFRRPAEENDEVFSEIEEAASAREDAVRRIRALEAEVRARSAR